MANDDWHFYQVKFDLGLRGTEQHPEDPAEFLLWLTGQDPKYIGGLTVESAVITTTPA